MKKLISQLTSNIGTKLKKFCIWFYLIECLAGFIIGIVGFIWGLTDGLVFFSLLFLLGGLLLPLTLYPVFMFFYGYCIIVHKMEKGEVSEGDTIDSHLSITNIKNKVTVKKPSRVIPKEKEDNKSIIILIFLIVILAVILIGIVGYAIYASVVMFAPGEVLEEVSNYGYNNYNGDAINYTVSKAISLDIVPPKYCLTFSLVNS